MEFNNTVLSSLPLEIYPQIFANLEIKDSVNFALTCKAIHNLVFNPSQGEIWRLIANKLEITDNKNDKLPLEIGQLPKAGKFTKFKRKFDIWKRPKKPETPTINLKNCLSLVKACKEDVTPNYARIIANFIISGKNNGVDTFFTCSTSAKKLRKKFGIKPSIESLDSGIKMMRHAAINGIEDHQTFDQLADEVLPVLKDEKTIRSLYAAAIGTLPLASTENMEKYHAIERQHLLIKVAVETRIKTSPEFQKYL